MNGRIAFSGCVLFAVATCFAAAEPRAEGEGSESEILYFSRLASLGTDESNSGSNCNLRATVTHVSALRPGLFILASSDRPYQGGIPVMLAPGVEAPEEGDEIWVRGRTKVMLGRLGIDEATIAKVGEIPLDFSTGVKYSDFRKGMLDFRRVMLRWRVKTISDEVSPDGVKCKVLRMTADGRIIHLRIPVKPDMPEIAVYAGQDIRAIGCVIPVLDADGKILSRCIEVSDASDVEVIVKEQEGHGRAILWGAASLLGVALLVALVALMRSRRERIRMEIILAERKRMAADLHDTIEQHLASARLVLAGVAADKSLSQRSRDLVAHAGDILMRAKTETRDAVLNLRSDESQEKSPAQAIREMAKVLAQGGLEIRTLLRGLPERLPQGRHQDLIAIVREAVTNAIKHGHAKRLAITADPLPDGFLLRIVNDGEQFDPDKALGPETGHFGLAGMRERAVRSAFRLAFVADGKWCGVRIDAKNPS